MHQNVLLTKNTPKINFTLLAPLREHRIKNFSYSDNPNCVTPFDDKNQLKCQLLIVFSKDNILKKLGDENIILNSIDHQSRAVF